MTTRRNRLAAALTALAGVVATFGALAPATAQAALPAAPTVDNRTRTGALNAYNAYHQAALKVSTGWNGSTSSCLPGAPSADAQAASLTTVNYYRRMVGLQPATLDSTWSAKAQKAALVMQANNMLTHDVPTTAKCYTTDGANAAATGNIALGYTTGPGTVDAYISDHGANNAGAVGHRRWLLDPRIVKVGNGQTGAANTIKLFDTAPSSSQANPTGTPAWVSWPDAGYVPSALLPKDNLWSVSASDRYVDFTYAKVTVKSNGVVVPTTTVPLKAGYGRPAIGFKPTTGYAGGSDRTYTITVSGMRRAGVAIPSYTYSTTLFDARYSRSPQSISWSTPGYVYKGATATLAARATSGLVMTYASSTPAVCSVVGTKVTYLAEGSCSIVARQAGNTTWAPVSTTRNILVWVTTKKSNVISWAQPTTATKGTSRAIGATSSSGLAVTYTSKTPTVCTVSGGTVTHVEPGTCTVTATQGGSSTVNRAVPVTRSWTVGGLRTNSITWNPPANVTVGTSIPLNPTAASGSGSFSYGMYQSAAGTCTVYGGSIIAKQRGTCTITVSQAATSQWTSASITRTITVS